MNFINSIIQKHGEELTSQLLSDKDFNLEQSQRFLPEAGRYILQAIGVNSRQLNSNQLNHSDNLNLLLNQIDIKSLAQQTEIEPELAQQGVQAILPRLLDLLQERIGNLKALLPILGSGHMLGKAGGLLGRLSKGSLARV